MCDGVCGVGTHMRLPCRLPHAAPKMYGPFLYRHTSDEFHE